MAEIRVVVNKGHCDLIPLTFDPKTRGRKSHIPSHSALTALCVAVVNRVPEYVVHKITYVPVINLVWLVFNAQHDRWLLPAPGEMLTGSRQKRIRRRGVQCSPVLSNVSG